MVNYMFPNHFRMHDLKYNNLLDGGRNLRWCWKKLIDWALKAQFTNTEMLGGPVSFMGP